MAIKADLQTEKKQTSTDKETGGIFDLAMVLIQAVIIAGVLRVFLFQPFNIPSGSMIPTLLIGDYLFVSKYSYGFSKYSFPFGLNLFDGRFLSSEPKRGDVIVFKKPSDNYTDYIKRLVGLPGEKIQMIGGVLHIEDKPVLRKRAADVVMESRLCGRQAVHQYEETNPEGRTYLTQKLSETCSLKRSRAADDTDVFVVPPGHYFMMGDNRDDSADSRFQDTEGVGFVPRDNLVGRARAIFFSVDEDASWFAPWRWPMQIRWFRLGDVIR